MISGAVARRILHNLYETFRIWNDDNIWWGFSVDADVYSKQDDGINQSAGKPIWVVEGLPIEESPDVWNTLEHEAGKHWMI